MTPTFRGTPVKFRALGTSCSRFINDSIIAGDYQNFDYVFRAMAKWRLKSFGSIKAESLDTSDTDLKYSGKQCYGKSPA